MKKAGVLFLLMAAMLVAVPAYNTAIAAPRGHGYAQQRGPEGGPWHHPEISAEQRAAYQKAAADYRAKAQPIYNDIWAKQTELEYLSRNDNTDPKVISKMVSEIKMLREQAQKLHESSAAKLAKDLNISSDHAFSLLGYGHRGAGMGMGMGCDGPRGGGMYGGPHHRGVRS